MFELNFDVESTLPALNLKSFSMCSTKASALRKQCEANSKFVFGMANDSVGSLLNYLQNHKIISPSQSIIMYTYETCFGGVGWMIYFL